MSLRNRIKRWSGKLLLATKSSRKLLQRGVAVAVFGYAGCGGFSEFIYAQQTITLSPASYRAPRRCCNTQGGCPQCQPSIGDSVYDENARGDGSPAPGAAASNLFSANDTMASAPRSLSYYMIGDLIGGSSAQSLVSVDRLYARTDDIDTSIPFPSALPFTGSEGPTLIGVLDSQGNILGISPTAMASFTTAISATDMLALLNSGASSVPIVDNPDYANEVTPFFLSRNGAGGNVVFDPTGSSATLQSPSPPYVGGELEDFDVVYAYNYVMPVAIPSPSGGALVGRMKLADNNSPLPADRVFLDYSFFRRARITSTGVDVNRFTPGVEKTFFDGMTSVELRVPMFLTMDNDLHLGDNGQIASDMSTGQFGNIGVILKGLLYYDNVWAVAGGVGIQTPTAADTRVFSRQGEELVRIENDSVQLVPYFAVGYTPNDRWFAQAFFQVSVDTNGNDTLVSNGNGLSRIGRLQDQTLMYFDVAVGKWLYRNDYATRGLTGLNASLEVHYNRTLNNMDSIQSGAVIIGDPSQQLDLVNLTVGSTAVFANDTTVTVGYGFPVTDQKMFDGELRVFLNRFF